MTFLSRNSISSINNKNQGKVDSKTQGSSNIKPEGNKIYNNSKKIRKTQSAIMMSNLIRMLGFMGGMAAVMAASSTATKETTQTTWMTVSTSAKPKLRATTKLVHAQAATTKLSTIPAVEDNGSENVDHGRSQETFQQPVLYQNNYTNTFNHDTTSISLTDENPVISYLDFVSSETTSEQSLRFLTDRSPRTSRGPRRRNDTNTTSLIAQQRGLQQVVQEGPYFRPLDCQRPVCEIRTTWTEGQFDRHAALGTVIIPCGTCVWMDYVAPGAVDERYNEDYLNGDYLNEEMENEEEHTLELPHGIDIQGHLYFPDDGYKLTIETPFVLVQGRLEIPSTGTVGENPNIKILITKQRKSVSFLPAHNNERVCPDATTGAPGLCNIGLRPIVVAGGTIRTQGLPSTCKTWTTLEDVLPVRQEEMISHAAIGHLFSLFPHADVNHPNPKCRRQEPYIKDDFNVAPTTGTSWTGGYGASFSVENGIFVAENRKSIAEHGPTIDMMSFEECLIPDQIYLFSAKIRLHDPNEEDEALSPCDAAGCLGLEFQTRLPHDGEQLPSRKGKRYANDRYRNNVWENFYDIITFNGQELNTRNAYQILKLRGAPTRYNIYMDNVTFSLPPPSLAPNPGNLCGGNLVLNGDAEASDIHPYPMTTWLGGHLTVVETTNGNHAFRVSQRNHNFHSLAYHLGCVSCIEAGARYFVSARINAESDNIPIKIMIKYQIKYRSGRSSITYTAAECSASQNTWQTCRSKFVIDDATECTNIRNVRFWFETVDAPNVDYMVDDFVIEKAPPPKAEIVVPAEGIVDCWGEGAEIVITSHTTNTADSQVRRLVHHPILIADGMVRLELNETISSPVTRKHEEGLFPVEVALLSRNIRFESPQDEEDPLLGGHFMVLRTPDVVQRIEGIEVVNFGQQGNLGRYPIHMHLSKNTPSVIARNSIRGSNQRCVVIHGTHNTTIVENIAYDTFGHCFMTEDGGEVDNKFIRNLGSNTKSASRLVREGETDVESPATFWTANPMNEWIGNVAAGCEGSGYWIELLPFVKHPSALLETSINMNPRVLPMTSFVDNIAHSNFRHGLRMYPHGFIPAKTARFENFKSYKNRRNGIFFRNVANSIVQGGIFADNRYQADFDKSDSVLMNATRVIGRTQHYLDIVRTQKIIDDHKHLVVGLELHPFARNPSNKGLTVQDIVFEGFRTNSSSHTALVEIDREADDPWSGNFNYWTTFEGIQIKDSDTPFHFDMVQAVQRSYKSVYLVDLDSSMKPESSNAQGTSTVVANSDEMLAFLDRQKCTPAQSGAYLYCQETCIRSVTFGVDPGQDEDIQLEIVSDVLRQTFRYEGSKDVLTHGDVDRHERAMTELRVLRYYTAALPPGQYKAAFVNRQTGKQQWPTFVETTFDEKLCSDTFDSSNVALDVPEPESSECHELVRNGDMEQSEDSSVPFWLQHSSILEVAKGRGRMGSTAIAEADVGRPYGALAQYLDVRCLTEGQTYVVKAWAYLEDRGKSGKSGKKGGKPINCEDGNSGCPRLALRFIAKQDDSSYEFTEFAHIVATSFARPYSSKGWNLLQGVVTLSSEMAQATKVAIIVERRFTGRSLLIDDVSMTPLQRDCSELVLNGDFSEDKTLFWDQLNGSLDLVSISKDNALQHSKRSNSGAAITQQIATGCMHEGNRFVAKAKVRTSKQKGYNLGCNPTKVFGNDACPRMRLRADNEFPHHGKYIASADHGVTSDGWMTITEVFTATESDELAERSILYIDGPSKDTTVIVDKVSITPIPMNCDQLILNGDAELGETAQFWRLMTMTAVPSIEVHLDDKSDNHSFAVVNRRNPNDGLVQKIDNRCLSMGSKWNVQADIQLLSRSTGKYVVCDSLSCPLVSILAQNDDGSNEWEENFRMTPTNKIDASSANQFYHVESVAVITENLLMNGGQFYLGFRGFDSDWDFHVDNISVMPLA